MKSWRSINPTPNPTEESTLFWKLLLGYMTETIDLQILEAYSNTQVIFDHRLEEVCEVCEEVFLVPSFQNPSWEISFSLGHNILVTEGKNNNNKNKDLIETPVSGF